MILVKMNGEVYTLRDTVELRNLRIAHAKIWMVNIATGTEAQVHYSKTANDEVFSFDERVVEVLRVLVLAGAEVFGWDDELTIGDEEG